MTFLVLFGKNLYMASSPKVREESSDNLPHFFITTLVTVGRHKHHTSAK